MPADRLLHPRAGRSHKVSMLTDLEYRVWTQYLLSADDFGVMHATAVALQNDNLHLASRPAKVVKRCLDALVGSGLLRRFEHQGQPYVFQHDWQKWQKVEYPRATINPMPSAEALVECEATTGELFAKHPGGQRKDRRRADGIPSDSERASQTHPEGVPPTRAGAPAKRLTATGERLAANGSEGGSGDAFDGHAALLRLQAEYPAHRVTRNGMTSQAFWAALSEHPAGPAAAFALMLENLDGNRNSHEWRVKGMIPRLEKYLRDGLWLNVLPADAPAGEQVSAKTMRMLA